MRTIACVLVAAIWLPSGVHAQQAGEQAPIPVGVVVAEKKPVIRTLNLVGRVDAIQRVEVKARITGYLEKVEFKEGDFIKEGARLYTIEKGLFEAAVSQAQGVLEKDQSAKTLTKVQLERAADLLAKGAGTVVARDQALAADQSADGALLVDEANLQTAKINLGYTEITSPIAGKIGKTNITKGNVVGPDSGVLTTIVSQDPMYVTFPVSQREFIVAQKEGRGADTEGIKATLYFSDGTPYKHSGKISFVDVTVNRSTDTVLARATFPNPDAVLVDGQLARIGLERGSTEEQIVIPQAALISDQQGVYVFVADQGKAAIRRLKLGGSSGTGVIVSEGLNGGDQVIMEGIQALRPNAAVRPTVLAPSPDRS